MKTILFDLDGTLTDPKTGITRSIRYALLEIVGEAPDVDELTWCIGPPLLGSFEKMTGSTADARKALDKYRERFSDVGLFENDLYVGIAGTLQALVGAGNQLFVATSKPTVYAKRITEHFGLSRYFEDVCGAHLDGRLSDKTELIASIIGAHGIKTDQAVMIGDRSYDIIGAKNNAISSIGVTYGYGSKTELVDAGANETVDTTEQLLRALTKT